MVWNGDKLYLMPSRLIYNLQIVFKHILFIKERHGHNVIHKRAADDVPVGILTYVEVFQVLIKFIAVQQVDTLFFPLGITR